MNVEESAASLEDALDFLLLRWPSPSAGDWNGQPDPDLDLRRAGLPLGGDCEQAEWSSEQSQDEHIQLHEI